ncbi:DoxX family protein [Sulfurimonas lithotrophica]|uniref:DoxX family protein n=1 Tax=Sulfurimonas lithotrophica TaxID=2590022 RepID=A0A5P8P2P3_9BACT|nr:DoxX family protein [Sulfurimonas lithotrophica]QFR50013.1 DoxX family protein [Sulfurimonas lithotrophica]
MFHSPDIAKLILRISVGVLMLFHGFEKIINGISGVRYLTTNAGLPEFFAYGVFVGELVFPVLIILGLYARVASLGLAFTMLMAIFLAHGSSLFELGKHGAPVIELPLLYLLMSIVIFLLGSGKYAVNSK